MTARQQAALAVVLLLGLSPAATRLARYPAAAATINAETADWRPGIDDPPPRTPRLLVPLNQASPGELSLLPGVGPTLAQRIVQRRRSAAFVKVDQLLDVHGIGPGKLENIRPLVHCDEGEKLFGF